MRLRSRGQAGGAAAFVAIMTLLIILYILFLPPDIRTQLLGTATGPNISRTGTSGNTLLDQNIGQVSYVSTSEQTYYLPSTTLESPTSGQIIKSVPQITVTNALFDTAYSAYELDFDLVPNATKNVLLSFAVANHNGPIIITLNGAVIYSGEVASNNPKPISIDQTNIANSNKLIISVQSPGLAFWQSNTYTLTNLQVTADVTDYTNSAATQYFTISKAVADNIDTATLYFYPTCNPSTAGALQIGINHDTIYNSMADCGTRTFAALDNNFINPGSNAVTFSSSSGTYNLDNIYVVLTMKEPTYPTYYFDLSSDYFTSANNQALCGAADGVCPPGCSASVDPDCCFAHSGFWCALPTLNANDRCSYSVSADQCGLCKTGYSDVNGNIASACAGLPGDNNDGTCPATTTSPSRYYDKDCCFGASSSNFWCNQVPITGLSDRCISNVDPSQCNLCPSGYINNNNAAPNSCNQPTTTASAVSSTYNLLSQYAVQLTVRFVDDTTEKRLNLNINGNIVGIDTTNITYSTDISKYVEQGTNSIQVVPVYNTVDVTELKTELQQAQ